MKKYIKPQIEVSNIELSSMDFAFDDDWGYEE